MATTIWATLTPNFPAPGGVLFIGVDGQTTWIESTQFWFNPNNYQLSVGTNGDQSGTDSINVYGCVDAYDPVNTVRVAAGQSIQGNSGAASHTVSASRGTSGANPIVLNGGDYVGKFGFWGYTQNPDPNNTYGNNYGSGSPIYVELSYLAAYAAGSSSSAAGLGSYLAFAVKGDNVQISEILKLTTTVLQPTTQNGLALGAVGFSFSWLYLGYQSITIPGNSVVTTHPTGRLIISSGTSTMTINNSGITAASIVQCQSETVDSGGAVIAAVAVSNAQAVVTLSKNCAANFQFTFVIHGN